MREIITDRFKYCKNYKKNLLKIASKKVDPKKIQKRSKKDPKKIQMLIKMMVNFG